MDSSDQNIDSGRRSSAATGRRKHYRTLKEEDIKRLQQTDISTVAGVLSVPEGVACALLCRNNWCLISAYDQWFSAADGDGEVNPNSAANSESIEQVCKICYESIRATEAVSAACGHPFCAACLKNYIAAAISDGATCLTLRCPEPRCRSYITSDMVKKLASEADVTKYHQHLRRSYVESHRDRRWCPAAGCGRAVELLDDDNVGALGHDVVCDCSHRFCWTCGEDSHRPIDCTAAAEWAATRTSEAALNAEWLVANAKPCPKCRRPIEKIQSTCNHITCPPPCGFDFCWACLAPRWCGVGDSCSRCLKFLGPGFCGISTAEYEAEQRRRRRDSKRFEDRYIQYYGGWHTSERSRRKAVEASEKAKKKKKEYVVEAMERMVEGWGVLTWSHVYGYHLREDGGKTVVLEYLQGEVEAALERLRRCVEEEGRVKEEEYRLRVVNLTRVSRKYFENLVKAMKSGLGEVESYGVDWEKEVFDLVKEFALEIPYSHMYEKEVEGEEFIPYSRYEKIKQA